MSVQGQFPVLMVILIRAGEPLIHGKTKETQMNLIIGGRTLPV